MIFKEKSRQIGCTLYNLNKVGTLCYNNVILRAKAGQARWDFSAYL
jgi:hypothetical protein